MAILGTWHEAGQLDLLVITIRMMIIRKIISDLEKIYESGNPVRKGQIISTVEKYKEDNADNIYLATHKTSRVIVFANSITQAQKKIIKNGWSNNTELDFVCKMEDSVI